MVSIEPLPKISPQFITSSELAQKIMQTSNSCIDANGNPILTIMDFRNEIILNSETPPIRIESSCKTINLLLDNLLEPDIIQSIPRHGLIVTVTETGNRDEFVIRYLSKFGFTNIMGLKFGMRDWIKNDYPVE